MDFLCREEEKLAEERERHSGVVDFGAGAIAGGIGEELWDRHKREKERERLAEQGAYAPYPQAAYGAQGPYPEGPPATAQHHGHGLLDTVGGALAGAVVEHEWDKHKMRKEEREVDVSGPHTEGPFVQGGGEGYRGSSAGYEPAYVSSPEGYPVGGYAEERREGYGPGMGRYEGEPRERDREEYGAGPPDAYGAGGGYPAAGADQAYGGGGYREGGVGYDGEGRPYY